MSNSLEYDVLAKARIQSNRDLVISQTSKGGYTIAQKLEVKENNHTIDIFLKSAFHIDDVQGLYNLRDALNTAIGKVEKK